MQVTNWVKCSDRLPAIGGPVFVILNRDFNIMFLDPVDLDDETRLSIKWEYQSVTETSEPVNFHDVTHWMPLPPMPEGE
ncbi:DUF551 domain-containing protein [Providencia rettgeri]|uniref:DUF551 domain-containing protein n=1 Tax=Providencia rettgeri TaxID=587 RepID=UPI0013742E8F|nr:DUF551 domain-containing protein [Providencia rettgeri]BBU96522.1 hypothetical protein BML2496_24050 [Providencia rettgeri]